MFFAGTSSRISEQNLKGSDIDSDNLKLRYILTKDPPAGKLQLGRDSHVEKVSVKGPVQSFTQDDVNKGARFKFHFLMSDLSSSTVHCFLTCSLFYAAFQLHFFILLQFCNVSKEKILKMIKKIFNSVVVEMNHCDVLLCFRKLVAARSLL